MLGWMVPPAPDTQKPSPGARGGSSQARTWHTSWAGLAASGSLRSSHAPKTLSPRPMTRCPRRTAARPAPGTPPAQAWRRLGPCPPRARRLRRRTWPPKCRAARQPAASDPPRCGRQLPGPGTATARLAYTHHNLGVWSRAACTGVCSARMRAPALCQLQLLPRLRGS